MKYKIITIKKLKLKSCISIHHSSFLIFLLILSNDTIVDFIDICISIKNILYYNIYKNI